MEKGVKFYPAYYIILHFTHHFALYARVRRVALTRFYARLTVAAGDPPDTNIVLGEYQATSENLPELNVGKQTKTEAKKEKHFPNLGLSYLR